MSTRTADLPRRESRSIQWVTRIRSIRLAMDALAGIPQHVMIMLPTTRTSLILARQICNTRECCITEGTITSSPAWGLAPFSSSPAQIAQSFRGKDALPRTVISFPDQLSGHDVSFAWIPFLGAAYLFSVIEALLVLRHRPRVFALSSCSPAGDFHLTEVLYADLLDSGARLSSLQALMRRLLQPLESELAAPPSDWLAVRCMTLKSEAHWRFVVREKLKDLEGLLRLHLLSPACDRARVVTAIAAVVARQRSVVLCPSPGDYSWSR